MDEQEILDGEVVSPEDTAQETSKALTPAEQRRNANLIPFKPGQTLNPGGRPKTKHVRDALLKYMTGKEKGSNKVRLNQLIEETFKEAMEGSVKDKVALLKILSVSIDGRYTAGDLEGEEVTPQVVINVLAPREKA